MARRKGLVASPSSNFWLTGEKHGAPEGTRTPNLLIRSQVLYPIELRALKRPWRAGIVGTAVTAPES